MEHFTSLFLATFFAIIFLNGCAQNPPDNNTTAAKKSEQSLLDACVQACLDSKAAGNNLEGGPCLLNPMPQNNSWVCDVAHDPRQDIDNLPENRCSAFGTGETNHFIEVNPQCEFIKKW